MQLAGRQPRGCGGISVLSSAPKELGLQLFEGETARCFKAIYLRVPDLVDLSRDTGALRGLQLVELIETVEVTRCEAVQC